MKYILLGFILLLLAMSTTNAMAWEPTEDCSPEERQSPGNTNTPCNVVFPESQSTEYLIEKHYPHCIETMRIHFPGMKYTVDSEIYFFAKGPTRTSQTWYTWGGTLPWSYSEEHIVVYGWQWSLRDAIKESHFSNPDGYLPDLYITDKDDRNLRVNAIQIARPRTDNVAALVSACLALVQQEKDDKEHAVRLVQEEADAEARRIVEADATAKEQEQALRDAESQAREAEAELEAAQERQKTITETELLKTETLRIQLAHEEIIAGILQEIARIRLAGQKDRARLTNEYLIRVESSAAAFDLEREEIERTIQAYLDFNTELLEQLEQYRANIARQLEEVELKLEAQRARIEEINTLENSVPSTPSP